MEQPWLQVLVKVSGAGSMPMLEAPAGETSQSMQPVGQMGQENLVYCGPTFVSTEGTPELNLLGILSWAGLGRSKKGCGSNITVGMMCF